jgi:aldehyde dehydrogenase (NAD+)
LHPTHQTLLDLLQQKLPTVPPVETPPPTALLSEAAREGATLHGAPGLPYLVLNGTPQMAITRSDVFYPVLSVLRANSPEHAAELHNASPLSLTAAIFGQQTEWLAAHLTTGTVLINDLIVPTADPRIPFGGRGASGFGLTRGAEGLLELTTSKTITRRRNRNYRHFQPTTPAHEALFTGLIELTHAGPWRARFAGLRKLVQAARNF